MLSAIPVERLGVISRVEEPTDWCAGMVVVAKADRESVPLCVDLIGLNVYVCREKYILPSVEQSLGLLAGAKKRSANWMPTWGSGRSHSQKNQPNTLHSLHPSEGFILTDFLSVSPQRLNTFSA